jgi:hypothetical protein
MSDSSFIIERYEMKYRIPGRLVEPIRECLRRYCIPDKASDGPYSITSLYLDNPDRQLYFDTQIRAPRRFKLRVRTYGTGRHFLEIKRRVKNIVSKSRVALPEGAWPRVFHDSRYADELALDTSERQTLDEFVSRTLAIGAQPAALVRYRREAWNSTSDDYARVTFDSKLETGMPEGWHVPYEDGPRWRPVDSAMHFGLPASGVVLELKCTMSVPYWMTDIVGRFALRRSGFSKYCGAVEGADPYRQIRFPSRWSAIDRRRAR